MSEDARFDVIAVDLASGDRRKLAENKNEADAEAIIKMAVIRRGVDVEYFTKEPCP